MKRKIKVLLKKFSLDYFLEISTKLWRFYKIIILNDKMQYNIREWHRNKGDETLRLNYPLYPESVVFDIGGYRGDFTEKIFKTHFCTVFLFEPIKTFYDICSLRFQGNKKITCHNFGLSSDNGEFIIRNEGSASSLLSNCSIGEKIEIVDISKYIQENTIDNIDLMKINVEGAEYDILSRLIETGLIKKCNYLQIQFHDFVENATEKRNYLREKLSLTHKESWCFPFIWESWERIEVK
jgi:FkbM family methyltransferase